MRILDTDYVAELLPVVGVVTVLSPTTSVLIELSNAKIHFPQINADVNSAQMTADQIGRAKSALICVYSDLR